MNKFYKKYANNRLNRSKAGQRVWLTLFIIILALILLTVLNQIRVSVENPVIFSLQFTNVSFAVFLGLGNVTFSWSRSLEKTDYNSEMLSLNRVGVTCICCAIIMIFISLLTFILYDGVLANVGDDHILVKLILFTRAIALIFSFSLVVLILRKITIIAWKVIALDKFKNL